MCGALQRGNLVPVVIILTKDGAVCASLPDLEQAAIFFAATADMTGKVRAAQIDSSNAWPIDRTEALYACTMKYIHFDVYSSVRKQMKGKKPLPAAALRLARKKLDTAIRREAAGAGPTACVRKNKYKGYNEWAKTLLESTKESSVK